MAETARRKRRSRSDYTGGLEGLLDGVAVTLLVLGVIVAVIVLLAIEDGGGIFPALRIGGSSFLSWLLLRALAELIRIQKKAAGLQYGGRITEAREVPIYECSECGAILYDTSLCNGCGRTIRKEAGD